MPRYFFKPSGEVVIEDATPENPDAIPDEDAQVLRRVLVRFMFDSGQTLPQIRARFAAAKRAVE